MIPPCDYYFDKGYKFAYATFYELPAELPGEWDKHTSWNMFQDCSPCTFRGCSYVSASFSHGQ